MNARPPRMGVPTRGFRRREFLGASALGSAALLGGGWSAGLGAALRRLLGFSGDGEPWMDATIPQLQAMMQTGQRTSRSLTQSYLARIASLNPLLHAVVETNPQAVSIAAQRDNERRAGRLRGPLHGIPVLLKDNIATADTMQTTAGSLALVNSRVPSDAPLVARLRAAGAVLLGKANLSESANFRGFGSSDGWRAEAPPTGRRCGRPTCPFITHNTDKGRYLMMRPAITISLSLLCALGAAAPAIGGESGTRTIDPAFIMQQYQGTKLTPAEAAAAVPSTANPWTSLRPEGATVDWVFWEARRYQMAMEKAAQNKPAKVRMTGASGKGTMTVSSFGTGPSQANTVQISGEFSLPPASDFVPNPEDEGSIPLASETGLTAGAAIVANGVIGDGDFGLAGTGSGDFDFFAIRGVSAGTVIVVDVDTEFPFFVLDPAVAIYNADGDIVAFNDDSGGTFDSFVSVKAPADGDYFVSIGTFGNPVLADPFDSSSGGGVDTGGFGVPNEGTYSVTIGLNYFDERVFAFTPKKGDVIGAAINGAPAELLLIDRSGTLRQGSQQPANSFFNTGSPLPEGSSSVGHIVDRPGVFTLKVRGSASGPFTLDLAAYSPELRTAERGEVQTIFVDFDGETVDLAEVFGGPSDVRTLSPLADFLPNWGLTATDEDAVIDAILARVEESLVTDLDWLGPNPKFEIRLLNSRDHADPWGEPNVSRLIVGGSIAELGIATIGIAQSIDVGNYATEETAFILLDVLSGAAFPSSSSNLNNTPRAPGVSIIDLIGVGVGEITAHEAGHYLGCWHTDQFNPIANIMDQGGNITFSILGLGPDGIFGTGDDTNVQFVRDEFNPGEGFTGIEDNQSAIAFGSTQAR